ncbi:MAG: MBL fold metallo-hydrolase [Paraperlucidibaca sp.]
MAGWKKLIGLAPRQPLPYVISAQPHTKNASAEDASSAADPLTIRYLGTAGFVLSHRHRTIVLDPYLTRPGILASLTQRLLPNAALIAKHIPHADDVLIGHAHHDHILDGPDLCKQTGARLIGSHATRHVGLAAGLPESQLLATDGNEDIASGPWMVRGLPSRHGKVFGRIPFPGDLTAPPPWPPRMHELRHGLVLNWLVDTGSLKIMHIDSADFINEQLQGQHCDILCLCAIGRQARPNYVRDAITLLRPRWVIPCHWDTMVTPIDAAPDLLPGVNLLGFLDEIRAAGATPLLTPMLGTQVFT